MNHMPPFMGTEKITRHEDPAAMFDTAMRFMSEIWSSVSIGQDENAKWKAVENIGVSENQFKTVVAMAAFNSAMQLTTIKMDTLWNVVSILGADEWICFNRKKKILEAIDIAETIADKFANFDHIIAPLMSAVVYSLKSASIEQWVELATGMKNGRIDDHIDVNSLYSYVNPHAGCRGNVR